MGSSNDTVVNADGTISTVKINREVISIRGIVAGEYIVNAHYYSEREWVRKLGQAKSNVQGRRTKEVTVKIELHKVNPYTVLWTGEKKFFRRGQEETFLRFRLDKDGTVLTPFTFEEKKFISPMGTTNVAPTSQSFERE